MCVECGGVWQVQPRHARSAGGIGCGEGGWGGHSEEAPSPPWHPRAGDGTRGPGHALHGRLETLAAAGGAGPAVQAAAATEPAAGMDAAVDLEAAKSKIVNAYRGRFKRTPEARVYCVMVDFALSLVEQLPELFHYAERKDEFGHEVLSMSDYPVMAMAARIALNHHERWDGGGYPRGLSGSEIPIEASITTLVDVYDALRSERPYKAAMTHEQAMQVILEGDGRTDPKHFRPDVLAAFKGADQAMNHIFETMKD